MRMRKLCFCCCEPAKHAEKNEETGLGLLSEFTDDKSLQDEGIEMYARRIKQQPQQITSNDQSRVALPQEELDGVEMLANATEQLPKHQASDGPFRITVESSNEDIVKESLYMRFLRSENGDQTKAVDRLKKTIAWRAEVGASTALSSAQPNFWIIKSFVPHVLHGRDRSGRPVIYSKPSGMQLKILKSHGLSLDDFVKHYVFLEEHLAANVHDSDHSQVIKVIDLGGLRQRDLTRDLQELMKLSIRIGQYYPQKTYRILLINKPFWAGIILTFLAAIMSSSEKKKLKSFGVSSTLPGLTEYIEIDQIPKEFGGESTAAIGSFCDEVGVYHQVAASNTKNGTVVSPVLNDYVHNITGFLPMEGSMPTEFFYVRRESQKHLSSDALNSFPLRPDDKTGPPSACGGAEKPSDVESFENMDHSQQAPRDKIITAPAKEKKKKSTVYSIIQKSMTPSVKKEKTALAAAVKPLAESDRQAANENQNNESAKTNNKMEAKI